MNRYIVTIAGSICFLLLAIAGNAQQSGTLVIEGLDFESNKGIAIVHLFREQDDFPNNPFMQATGELVNGKATIVFNTIPYGAYAAILFQDENSNGILDHKLGFPNEPMGFSNEWTLSLFSGMPSFNKLKFEFDQHTVNYEIAIR